MAATDAALLRAEDETEAAHMQWLECFQKLGIAEMQRQMTYLTLGGRRSIVCPGCTRSRVKISELIGLRFGEMCRVQEVRHENCIYKSITGSNSYRYKCVAMSERLKRCLTKYM